DELRGQVVELALRHHLVSDYTSLVALDPTPARPQGAPLHQGEVPANLPAGWDFEALTGTSAGSAPSFPAYSGPALARTSTTAALQLLVGVLLLALGFLVLLSRGGSSLLAAGHSR